jgi:hypothetical protein
MSELQSRAAVKSEIDRLTPGVLPVGPRSSSKGYHKNLGPTPEFQPSQFIAPRHESVRAGELTDFHESELSETTEILGT